MKILITGATGFVGKTLIPYLYENGWEDIAVLVRNPKKARDLFLGIPELKIINTSTGWNNDIEMYNPDAVIHLATYFTGKSDIKSATEIINIYILFTTQLLESVSHTDCRYFINIGTFSEYRNGAGVFKANNLYSASKTAVRPIIQFYQSISDFKWVNVIVYSPYGRYNSQKKIIDYLIDAIDSETPVAFSKGEQILDFIHVDDMASFFSTLLGKIHTLPESYYEFHLGSGEGRSIREVAGIIEKIYGGKINADWGKLPYRTNDIMHAVAPISTNLYLLDWKSNLSIEDGIKILKEDMLKNIKKLGGGKFLSSFSRNPIAA